MVTSHDVARLAGVSQPTVSRALRGVSVSADTIARVRAAADALGYIPSEAGRALSTQRTNCIGIVAGELTNPFYPALIEPMRAELDRHGYRALLIPESDESSLAVERLSDGSLDGVLLTTSTVTSPLPVDLSRRGIPFVLVNRTVDGAPGDRCHFDNTGGAIAAAHHLADLGHSRIGMINGPLVTSTGRDRDHAFREALSARGITVAEQHIRQGAFDVETGHRAARSLLAEPDAPTALFCGNDVIALGACNARSELRREGHTADVAIVGFDDIALASWDAFRLTTVHGDLTAMAHESVRLLLARIENPQRTFEEVTIPTRLIVRGEDAAP